MCASIIAGGDGSETLLSSGIPNLQLDDFSIEFDGSDFLELVDFLSNAYKVNANGGNVTVSICIVLWSIT